MAKVTKSAVAPAPVAASTEPSASAAPVAASTEPSASAAPKAPKAPKEQNGSDKFVRKFDADGKATAIVHTNAKGEVVPCNTPQIKVIANLLETAGESGMTRKELCEKLPAAGLVTRQPVGRIVTYYQKPMADSGIITIVKADSVAAPAAV